MVLSNERAPASKSGLKKRPGFGHPGALIPVLAMACVVAAMPARSVDVDAAQDLAKASGCFKCHAVEKKKDGPALRDAAAKFREDPAGQDKLVYHVTSGEKVKFPDGHEEAHKKVKTQDPKATANLAQWILSLEGGKKY